MSVTWTPPGTPQGSKTDCTGIRAADHAREAREAAQGGGTLPPILTARYSWPSGGFVGMQLKMLRSVLVR